MKNLLLSIMFCAALVTALFAQTPQMTYQAVIRDDNGQLLSNRSVSATVKIMVGASEVFSQTYSDNTNAHGLLTVTFGSEDFSTFDWANATISCEVKNGTDVYIAENFQPVTAVPLAIKCISEDGSDTKVSAGSNVTVTGAGTVASPYIVGATAGGGFAHYIGELYGGGIIVSVWKESGVEHGLIASLTDVDTSGKWSSITSAIIGSTAQSPSDGQANTTAIIAQGDVSGAAYLCDNYSANGFDDWYLPAIWEINQCYNAAFVVNAILGATDGFQADYYWSSTENENSSAWYYSFYRGYGYADYKSSTIRVRAVRRF